MPSAPPLPTLLADPVELLADSLPDRGAADGGEPSVGDPPRRFVDLRWRPDGTGAAAWAAARLPGAAHLDWTSDLTIATDDVGVARFAPPDAVIGALVRAGIDPAGELVLYDDAASLFASRAWWALRFAGIDRVRILDGGIGAWIAAGGRLETLPGGAGTERDGPFRRSIEAPPAPTGAIRRSGPVEERPGRIAWSDARRLVGSPEVLFVAARPTEARPGEEARGLGFPPGSALVPAAATTVPGSGVFRPRAQLRALFAGARVERGRRIVCFDGTGIAASKLGVAALLAGYEEVGVYDGGWAEWGGRSAEG